MDKILIITNNDGGLYSFRKELLEKLSIDNEIIIACPDGDKKEFFESCGYKFINIDIDRRGMNPFRDIKMYKQCKKIIKDVNPDKVITYTIKPNIYGSYACKKCKVPYFVNITGLGSSFHNGNLIKKLVIFMYKIAIKKANKVFFENEGNCKVFIKHKILPMAKCVLLNGAGVNIQKYAFAPMPQDDEVKFCFVGRIMREKGVNELFEAIEKLNNNGYNATFDIFGGLEEDYSEKLESMITSKLIHYYGTVDDLHNRYKNYHCLILPSYHEGMANVLLEAASTGRALITSDIYGCKETVEDGVNGYLVEKANSEDLYNKIVDFIALNFEQKEEMGQASRKLMEDKFDKQKVVEKTIEELYV